MPLSQDHRLSATTALVLLLVHKDFYTQPQTLKYLSFIDLSSGKKLNRDVQKIWPFYGEVIKNRKFTLKKLIFKYLSQHKSTQVVILAAGLDPLSLEISSTFKTTPIFDVDKNHMNIKQKILNEVKTPHCIRCVTSNILDTKKLTQDLSSAGWCSKSPTLVIAEGISYYLTPQDFFKTVSLFQSNKKTNSLILEYLVPYKEVSEKMRYIPQKVFAKITQSCQLTFITHYTEDQIREHLTLLNGHLKKNLSLTQMEKERVNQNKFFPNKKDGWIQISYAEI